MTVPERTGVPRVTRTGLTLAAVLAAYTAWLFVLALVVWPQGLPQDFDTIATMSTEAVMVSKLTVLGFVPCPALFVGSIVCLAQPVPRSRAVAVARAIGALLLAASMGFGLFGLRTWGGFGW
jgi:hypothetical protein